MSWDFHIYLLRITQFSCSSHRLWWLKERSSLFSIICITLFKFPLNSLSFSLLIKRGFFHRYTLISTIDCQVPTFVESPGTSVPVSLTIGERVGRYTEGYGCHTSRPFCPYSLGTGTVGGLSPPSGFI